MKGFKKVIRDNRYLRWVLIISTFIFQGILKADKTEKWYRISFTILFSIICFLFLSSNLNFLIRIMISILLAHTLNFIVNVNFFVIIIHFLLLRKITKQEIFTYLDSFNDKVENKNWILYVASFGSLSRGDLKPSSDIDISIVRKPGLVNGLKAIIFSIIEKKNADLNKIPLELYISDNYENSFNRYRYENIPVIISDKENVLKDIYNATLTISEAKALNK